MKVSMFWSNDPKFYDNLTGGMELTGEVFVKVNCDDEIMRIKYHYNMEQCGCSFGKLFKNESCVGLLTECEQDKIPHIVEQFKQMCSSMIHQQSIS